MQPQSVRVPPSCGVCLCSTTEMKEKVAQLRAPLVVLEKNIFFSNFYLLPLSSDARVSMETLSFYKFCANLYESKVLTILIPFDHFRGFLKHTTTHRFGIV